MGTGDCAGNWAGNWTGNFFLFLIACMAAMAAGTLAVNAAAPRLPTAPNIGLAIKSLFFERYEPIDLKTVPADDLNALPICENALDIESTRPLPETYFLFEYPYRTVLTNISIFNKNKIKFVKCLLLLCLSSSVLLH